MTSFWWRHKIIKPPPIAKSWLRLCQTTTLKTGCIAFQYRF